MIDLVKAFVDIPVHLNVRNVIHANIASTMAFIQRRWSELVLFVVRASYMLAS